MDAQQWSRLDQSPRHSRCRLNQTFHQDMGLAPGHECDRSLTYLGSLPSCQQKCEKQGWECAQKSTE